MEVTKKTIIDNIEDRSSENLKITAFESLGGSSIDYKTFFEMVNVYAKGFLEMLISDLPFQQENCLGFKHASIHFS